MNIREVEDQLGIPRANVRYYEKEGLLHPSRSENNYRVYTEEDVETLRKIRLLRQLDMPIETILAVQSGELPLSDAVFRQMKLLENNAARLEQAQAVCRAMLEDQAAYPALDPARYENPAALPWADRVKWEKPPEVPPVEGAVWAFNPWQRLWARLLDMNLASLAAVALLAVVFHLSSLAGGPNLALDILEVLATWGIVFLAEPVLLCTWGTTPGKWLLGLELRNKCGKKLGFSQALGRTWGVFRVGYGYQLPIYNYYRNYQCWKICREEKELPYDLEDGNLYYSWTGERWGARAVLSVAVALVLTLASFWVAYQAILPPNRGDITPAEFFENVNFQSRRLSSRLGYSLWLDDEGYELADQTMDVSTNGGPVVHYRYGEPFDDHPVYRVETDGDGYVTAVILEQEEHFAAREDGSWVWLPASRVDLAVMAFAGTEGTGWQLTHSELLGWSGSVWDGTPIRQDGFTLTAELEQEGYQNGSNLGTLLIPEEGGGPCWYRFTMRLERTP